VRDCVRVKCKMCKIATCKLLEREMREYIAGIRLISRRKLREWEIMCGISVSQVKPSNYFSHVEKLIFASILTYL